jgi:hypothetical protein
LRCVNCGGVYGYAPGVTRAAAAEPDLMPLLAARTGRFEGTGADTTGEAFAASVTLSEVAAGAAVAVDLAATDGSGRVEYAEHGVFAAGEDGAPRYRSVSSSAPFHRDFGLRRFGSEGGDMVAVFGWGGPAEATAGFREEVTFVLYAGGDLGVAWAYGAPGEAFAPRSAARLSRS